MPKMKAFLVVNKYVKARGEHLVEGVFWKRKHARKYAQQLIEKTGSIRYKILYKIVTYRFDNRRFTD